jgi:hypothetical protein
MTHRYGKGRPPKAKPSIDEAMLGDWLVGPTSLPTRFRAREGRAAIRVRRTTGVAGARLVVNRWDGRSRADEHT